MTLQEFAIGALGRRTGTKAETIRYYERIGILPKPTRSANGRRVYNETSAQRLSFIRRCRDLGFTLEDIRSLLGLADQSPSCGEVFAITRRHLEGIRSKIEDLRKLERTLSQAAKDCNRDAAPDCPIIDALSAR